MRAGTPAGRRKRKPLRPAARRRRGTTTRAPARTRTVVGLRQAHDEEGAAPAHAEPHEARGGRPAVEPERRLQHLLAHGRLRAQRERVGAVGHGGELRGVEPVRCGPGCVTAAISAAGERERFDASSPESEDGWVCCQDAVTRAVAPDRRAAQPQLAHGADHGHLPAALRDLPGASTRCRRTV